MYGLVNYMFMQVLYFMCYRYSLIILDNYNLEELFPEDRKEQLNIVNGGVYIQRNRHLCRGTIDRFMDNITMTEPNNYILQNDGEVDRPCKFALALSKCL